MAAFRIDKTQARAEPEWIGWRRARAIAASWRSAGSIGDARRLRELFRRRSARTIGRWRPTVIGAVRWWRAVAIEFGTRRAVVVEFRTRRRRRLILDRKSVV